MQIFVNAINDTNAKNKWNSAITTVKRNLHNLSNGLRADSLNRVWAQFVKSYNRLINLLHKLDRKYGQFMVPSSDYYDEIPAVPLTTYKDFTVAVNLVFANINKIPKLNNPVLQIQNMTGQLEAGFRNFTRSYVNTANKESEVIKTQQRDREGHVTAFQNYIAKVNSYATAEQREIAQEYMEQVYEEALTETATQQSESLGDILTAIEDTIEAVNNTNNRNDETTSSLETAKSELEELIDRAGKAGEGFKEARDNLLEAGNAYNESLDALEKAGNARQGALNDLQGLDHVIQAGVTPGSGVGAVVVVDGHGYAVSYDPGSGEISVNDGKTYAYDETTGKWTNVDDPTDVASDEMGNVYDKMKDVSDADVEMKDAQKTVDSNKEALDKAQDIYGAAETEYNEARDALDTATGGTTEYKEID